MAELLSTLVTIFVIAWLTASWPEFWRAPKALWRRRGALLSDSEVGLAQLTLPPGWLPATDLNDGSWLQALDPMRNRYLMVISESREDFDADMDVQEHSSRTRAALASSVRLLAHHLFAHDGRRAPRIPSGAGMGNALMVRSADVRKTARRLHRTAWSRSTSAANAGDTSGGGNHLPIRRPLRRPG
jgi:hypothetical protein